MIRTLNPIIRGQANYYRPGASTKAFQALDDHLWRRLDKWARRRHPNKPRRWVTARYFGAVPPHQARPVGVRRPRSGAYLHRYAWTKIVRHAPVTGRHSPDDPALAQYWADRRRKRRPPQLAPSWEHALRTQHRRCPLCAEPLLLADARPTPAPSGRPGIAAIRKAMAHQAITQTSSGPTNHRLVHTHCARHHPGVRSHDPTSAADA